MTPDSEKRRPAGGDAQCLAGDTPSVAPAPDTRPGPAPTLTFTDADGMLDHVRGALVVLTTIDGAKYRRRVYLSAAAAEVALKRARAAGRRAEVVLCELRPVFLLGGDAS